MLRGHETLVRLVGKRRKLSLSKILPAGVKEEVKDFSSVATSRGFKEESVKVECLSTSKSEVAVDVARSSLLEDVVHFIQQDEAKCEIGSTNWAQCPVCAKSIRGGDLAMNSHLDFCMQAGANEGKRKSKQLTLSQFAHPGVANNFSSATSSIRVRNLTIEGDPNSFEKTKTEDNHKTLEIIKTEDTVIESGSKPPFIFHSRLKLKRVKPEIKQENVHDETSTDAEGNISWRDVEHSEPAPRLVQIGLHSKISTASHQPPQESGESELSISSTVSVEHLGLQLNRLPPIQATEHMCGCSCHLASSKADNSLRSESERDTCVDGEEVDGGRKVVDVSKVNSMEDQGAKVVTLSLINTMPGPFAQVLETRIVGRKYFKGILCEEGMQVSLMREPDNPKDANAIKIVTLGPPTERQLGHLPREISAHLSGLLDKGILHVEGFVIAVPEQIHGDVPLKLLCESRDSSTDFTMLNGVAEGWQSMVLAAENSISIQSSVVKIVKYQQNFLAMLQTVTERDSHLFKDHEKVYLGTFCSLSGDAQRLFIRLYQRKGPWFRLSSLVYKDVDDVSAASEELLASGYMTAACNEEEAPDVALRKKTEILNMSELRHLCCTAFMKKKREVAAARKEDLISTIVSGALQKHLDISGLSRSDSKVLEMVAEVTGSCMRVSEEAEFLLWRVQRLFFLDGERDLSSFLMVDMGLVKYPRYKCLRSRPVFPTHESLVAYEQALVIAQGMDMALEICDTDNALKFLDRACHELSCCESKQASAERTPTFLARFSASYVYKNVITVGVSILERERRYKEAVDALKQLLSSKVRSGRLGYWTLRLSIDLDHLGCKEESLKVAEIGVNEPWIRGGDRVALQRRVVRLGKPPRRWKKPAYADSLNRPIKEVQIRGRPLNCVTGVKSRFYGYDGEQCGVEELALQYYASEQGGGWQGVHCEGGVWMTLFGLLMWDILFADVPDVFQTSFQTAPLDLNTEIFYSSRQDMINTRLAAIAEGCISDYIAQAWKENFGSMCSGVNWERHSLSELQTIAKCIGGPGLAHVCRLLAEDHAGWRGGMPDLLLWRLTNGDGSSVTSSCTKCNCSLPETNFIDTENPGSLSAVGFTTENGTQERTRSNMGTAAEGEAKLVEVKGPRDRLSEQQTAWAWILMNGGLSVEVCKVLEDLKD